METPDRTTIVANGDEITVRQLLNHTSGLADGFTDPAVQSKAPEGCTVEWLLETEGSFPPVAEPGERWSYSNYGYNLLGRMVELVEGKDLGTVLEERITRTIGRPVDVVIANQGQPSETAAARYAAEDKFPLELGPLPPDTETVIGEFWRSDIARHDRHRLCYAVWAVLSRRLLA